MAKIWRDANEVIKITHELPSNKLRELDKEMGSIPKFDKCDKKKRRKYNGENKRVRSFMQTDSRIFK